MAADDEYRKHAEACLRVAEDVTNSQSRTLLIHMAQAWLRLASRAEKNLTAGLVHETPPSHNEAGASPVAQKQQQIQPK
jgi:hypothetical protein